MIPCHASSLADGAETNSHGGEKRLASDTQPNSEHNTRIAAACPATSAVPEGMGLKLLRSDTHRSGTPLLDGHSEAHGEAEGGALAQRAGHPEAAAHLGHQALADAQPQPRAAWTDKGACRETYAERQCQTREKPLFIFVWSDTLEKIRDTDASWQGATSQLPLLTITRLHTARYAPVVCTRLAAHVKPVLENSFCAAKRTHKTLSTNLHKTSRGVRWPEQSPMPEPLGNLYSCSDCVI